MFAEFPVDWHPFVLTWGSTLLLFAPCEPFLRGLDLQLPGSATSWGARSGSDVGVRQGRVCWAGGRLMLSVWIDRPLPACWVARCTSETNLARQNSTTLVNSVGPWLGRVKHVKEWSHWAKKHASWSASDSCSCWRVCRCCRTVRCVSPICRDCSHWVMVKSAYWRLLLYGFFTAHARYKNLSSSFAFSLLMFGDNSELQSIA